MKRKFPMSAEQRQEVLDRDRGCVAARASSLDPGECDGHLEVDHVREVPGAITKSDPRQCVTLCAKHHRWSIAGSVWATSHRPELRMYLASLYPE